MSAAVYKVEKGIPLPDHIGPGKARKKYPFDKMKVGDSFFVPRVKPQDIANCIGSWRRYHGSTRKFITRTVKGGARCWRIK